MSWGRSNRLSRIVKTYHTDGFDSVVEAAMVPVVVAGGKRLDSVRDALALASDAVTAGAAGIDFGRNVWQSDDPVATIQALRSVVHHGHGVDDALGLYERLAGRPVPAGR
jgi:3-hydroxy-5-phosphonooxypentane-2,4-dione thiolase